MVRIAMFFFSRFHTNSSQVAREEISDRLCSGCGHHESCGYMNHTRKNSPETKSLRYYYYHCSLPNKNQKKKKRKKKPNNKNSRDEWETCGSEMKRASIFYIFTIINCNFHLFALNMTIADNERIPNMAHCWQNDDAGLLIHARHYTEPITEWSLTTLHGQTY